MNLVCGGMVITKSELIVWEVCVIDWEWAFEYEFFKYFGKKGRRLIDLYKLGESAGFSGLSIIIIFENFQSKGN